MATNLFNFGPELDAIWKAVQAIQTTQTTILGNQTTLGATLMSALDDLNAAVASVQSAVDTAVALIQSLHQNPGGTSDADVEAAVAKLQAASAALGGAMPQP